LVLPALAIAPSDFSRIVVSPPALLPGDGLALISALTLPRQTGPGAMFVRRPL
jgi:hypothetical protein